MLEVCAKEAHVPRSACQHPAAQVLRVLTSASHRDRLQPASGSWAVPASGFRSSSGRNVTQGAIGVDSEGSSRGAQKANQALESLRPKQALALKILSVPNSDVEFQSREFISEAEIAAKTDSVGY